MKAKVLIVFIAAVVLTSCGKDVYTTSPQLTFTSVNGTIIPYNAIVDFKFNVTDKQGDIQDSMWLQRISFIPVCASQDSMPVGFMMPNFTAINNLNATVDLQLPNGNSRLQACISGAGFPVVDSCYFRFWIKDKAGNVSDTVTSPHIVLLDSL